MMYGRDEKGKKKMFGTILGGIGGLVGGIAQRIGPLIGGIAQGIGTLGGGITQGVGTAIEMVPKITSAFKPGIDLWSQWERQRTEEKLFTNATKLERDKLELQKRMALEKGLLSTRQVIAVPQQIISAKPAIPVSLQAAPGPAVLSEDNTAFVILVFVVIGVLLFAKK